MSSCLKSQEAEGPLSGKDDCTLMQTYEGRLEST